MKMQFLGQWFNNAASRLGFTYERTLRQTNVFKNRNGNIHWFSILDHEWPEINEQLKHWLDPYNFDHRGSQ